MEWLKTIADALRTHLEPLGFQILITDELSEHAEKRTLGKLSVGLGVSQIVERYNHLCDIQLDIGVGVGLPMVGAYKPNQFAMQLAVYIAKCIRAIAKHPGSIGSPGEAQIEYYGDDELGKGFVWVGIAIPFQHVSLPAVEYRLDFLAGVIDSMIKLAKGTSSEPLPTPEATEIQKASLRFEPDAGVDVQDD